MLPATLGGRRFRERLLLVGRGGNFGLAGAARSTRALAGLALLIALEDLLLMRGRGERGIGLAPVSA